MGYQIVTTLIYGVKVTDSQAKQILQTFMDSEGNLQIPNIPKSFRKLDNYFIQRNRVQDYPITPYPQFKPGIGEVLYPILINEDTDSRIHDLCWEEGFQSFFGIHICSKSGGDNEEFKYFQKNIPPEVINNFNTFLAPILKNIGLSKEEINQAELETINQTI